MNLPFRVLRLKEFFAGGERVSATLRRTAEFIVFQCGAASLRDRSRFQYTPKATRTRPHRAPGDEMCAGGSCLWRRRLHRGIRAAWSRLDEL